MIMLVLIVMHRDYNPGAFAASSLARSARVALAHTGASIGVGVQQTDSRNHKRFRYLKPKWEEHRELIEAIEKIGAEGTHVGDHLRWIANKVDDMENHTAMMAINTEH